MLFVSFRRILLIICNMLLLGNLIYLAVTAIRQIIRQYNVGFIASHLLSRWTNVVCLNFTVAL